MTRSRLTRKSQAADQPAIIETEGAKRETAKVESEESFVDHCVGADDITTGNIISTNQQSASRLRNFIFAVITVSLTVVVCLGSAEIVLRFLPVPSGLHAEPVNAKNPVFHYTPDSDVTFSRGWNFEMVNHRRVNNAGWVNDQDYKQDDQTPLLAIIGDS